MKVYLAGKIRKNDWRHSIFEDLRTGNSNFFGTKMAKVDGLTYNGPFFMSCDHGCFHGDGSHGLGIINEGCGSGKSSEKGEEPTRQYRRHDVIKKCNTWIKTSDLIFVWLDNADAYGTIAEIGMAYSMGKPIFIGVCKNLKESEDMWFPINLANYFCFENSAEDAWKRFISLSEKLSRNVKMIDDVRNAKKYQQ